MVKSPAMPSKMGVVTHVRPTASSSSSMALPVTAIVYMALAQNVNKPRGAAPRLLDGLK